MSTPDRDAASTSASSRWVSRRSRWRQTPSRCCRRWDTSGPVRRPVRARRHRSLRTRPLAPGYRLLPPEMEETAFAAVWRGIDAECRDLGVSITTGHTACYADASLPWVGAGTALAAGDPAETVLPDGARPGDAVVVTRGPAVETTGLLTTLSPDQVELPPETPATAQETGRHRCRPGRAGGLRDRCGVGDARRHRGGTARCTVRDGRQHRCQTGSRERVRPGPAGSGRPARHSG